MFFNKSKWELGNKIVETNEYVYHIKHLSTGKYCIMKTFHECEEYKEEAQFQREAASKNIAPKVYQVGKQYMIMVKAQGVTLCDLFEQYVEEKRLDELAPVIQNLVKAVRVLHKDLGIWHGDLHGDNILVDEDGRVQLIDFGSAERLSDMENKSVRDDLQELYEWFETMIIELNRTNYVHSLGRLLTLIDNA